MVERSEVEVRDQEERAPGPGSVCDGHNWAVLADDERLVLMRLLVGAHARLNRVLGTELEEACGLPLSWYIGMIRMGRATEGRITMTQLAAELSLTSGGITRMVDRMSEAGLVERQHCPSDRRSIYVALTPAGLAKLGEATEAHLASLDLHLIAPLDGAERAELAMILRKLGTDHTACPG
jgi:DNA-binding MarR family transcriptional regulator